MEASRNVRRVGEGLTLPRLKRVAGLAGSGCRYLLPGGRGLGLTVTVDGCQRCRRGAVRHANVKEWSRRGAVSAKRREVHHDSASGIDCRPGLRGRF